MPRHLHPLRSLSADRLRHHLRQGVDHTSGAGPLVTGPPWVHSTKGVGLLI